MISVFVIILVLVLVLLIKISLMHCRSHRRQHFDTACQQPVNTLLQNIELQITHVIITCIGSIAELDISDKLDRHDVQIYYCLLLPY